MPTVFSPKPKPSSDREKITPPTGTDSGFSSLPEKLRKRDRFGLRIKATLFAVAIGTIPVMAIGGIAYWSADTIVENEIKERKKLDISLMMEKVEAFTLERYKEIQVLSNLSIFKDPNVRKVTSAAQQARELTEYIQIYEYYDSIAFIDLDGNELISSQGTIAQNHKEQSYFQQVLQSGKPYISQPKTDITTNEQVIYFASPVRDSITSKIIGIVRARMPASKFEEVLREFGSKTSITYHLVDKAGIVFVTNDKAGPGDKAEKHLQIFPELRATRQNRVVETYESLEKRNVLAGYAALQPDRGFPNLEWDGFLLTGVRDAYMIQFRLAYTLIGGSLSVAIVVGIIAAVLANRAIEPIQKAAVAVEKIGQGDLDIRLPIESSNEVGILNANINRMADKIQQLLGDLQEKAIELQQKNERIAKETDILEEDVSYILDTVSTLEAGDLTVKAEVNERITGVVADSLNRSIEKFATAIYEVLSTAKEVSQKAQELENAAVATASQAQEQTESVGEVQSLMAYVNNLSQDAAEQALAADEAVQKAQKAVAGGQKELASMNIGMATLQEGTEQIVKRTETLIDFIQQAAQFTKDQKRLAAQTRVLALNASMLASRASGQQDPEQFASVTREFEVLAKQVSDLAVQTNQSLIVLKQRSDRIQTVGSGLNRDVREITRLVNDFTQGVDSSRQAFDQIDSVTERVAQVAQQVTTSSSAIAKAAQTTLQSISAIAAVAKKTEHQSSITRSQSSSMGEMASNLLESIEFFKVLSAEAEYADEATKENK
ncbi:MAG: methyl-accepting chemotaxis protein [Prochloraceae cyanobacterium]|nr:methyl-accepting chemotaxis protein [Prochloraceae cyanobacterium]